MTAMQQKVSDYLPIAKADAETFAQHISQTDGDRRARLETSARNHREQIRRLCEKQSVPIPEWAKENE